MCRSFSVIQGARVAISTDASNFTPQQTAFLSNKICVQKKIGYHAVEITQFSAYCSSTTDGADIHFSGHSPLPFV
jgi:hypothetical protein